MDGKALSKKIREEVKEEVGLLKQKGVAPGLAVIIVGEDPSSKIYVNLKKKACEEVGMFSKEYSLDENVTEQTIKELIQELNKSENIHGILLQLPLPKHLNEKKLLEEISPEKDVDGIHPVSAGKLLLGQDSFVSCTPAGVMEMLKEYNIDIEGKECVIIGRSNIVGKPQFHLLLKENGTVTICHSKTKDLANVCRRADILVAALGRAEFIKGDMIKEGAVVIDVGINRDFETNKIKGDVEFSSAVQKASYITPVPGGIGPMTIAMLLKNTLKACKAHYCI
ncbi:MAG: bifunctional methylenetetrahydrofolate dehydrogenase/methenyltetrahydrofolate cyclohydrolase FolD [Ignavibacteriales bacterium]